jgi:CRISPR-associated protein Csb2
LIATWHHKVKHEGKHAEAALHVLIESLAQELPEYRLPAASHSHTRHYMPQFAAGKTSLVFDAFATINPKEPLTVIWPNLNLPDDQCALLDDLLAVMGYLGRAESWVSACRLSSVPDEPEVRKCKPSTETVDRETGELLGETVTLYAALSAGEYRAIRQGFLPNKKAVKKLGKTLPDNLLDALSVATADLRKQGWNQPPAARKVTYRRPADALRPRRTIPKISVSYATTASFLLVGKPLPRVEDSLRIGELLRRAVMSKAKYAFGAGNIPPIFSGHNLPKNNRHRHAFYLPWDANGNGLIDHLLLHVPDGMNAEQRRVIEKLQYIRDRDGAEWWLVLEDIGDLQVGGNLTEGGIEWRSVTPYLHPWHLKKRFSIEDQICRECHERSLSEPINLEPLKMIPVGDVNRRLIEFRRFRSKRGLSQPDRHGSAWKLTFTTPFNGPLALGFGCHFGLGLFKAVR